MLESPDIPLARVADRWLSGLGETGLDGATLLGERATLAGLRVPGIVSAGGGCRLYPARGGAVALNLARGDDRSLLPALFETDEVDDPAPLIARHDADALVARGRTMGLAIAHEAERAPSALRVLVETPPVAPPLGPPRVADLSSLWAGPLCGHLLARRGAHVTKIESRTRPDSMRDGRDAALHARLEAGKRNVTIDFARDALIDEIAGADIVIEASRPRALAQLGIDADALVRARPGLVWISITAHGAEGDAADWVGFGDDTGVAGGLAAAMRRATGRPGFVGDAIADPLTGIFAAREGWRRWREGHGGRIAIAMSGVAATALAEARADDADALDASLRAWASDEGRPFPPADRHC
jgi:hypothetical protein